MNEQALHNEPPPRTEMIAYLLSCFVLALTAFLSPEAYPISLVLAGYTVAVGAAVTLISPRSASALLSFLPAFAFLFIQYLSSLWSVNLNNSLSYGYVFTILAMFSLMVCHSADQGSRNGMFRVLAAVVAVVSLYGIYQYAFGFERTREIVGGTDAESLGFSEAWIESALYKLGYRRAFSTFMSPNVFAGYLAYSLPFVGYMALRSTGRPARLVYASCLALGIAALFITRSVGGVAAFASGGVVFALVYAAGAASDTRRRILAAVTGAAVITAVAGYAVYSARTGGALGVEKSVAERLDYWSGAAEIFSGRPFTGYGAGSYGVMYLEHVPEGGSESRYAHNVFLQTMAETGLAGLAALLWLFAAYFLRVARLLRKGGDRLLYGALAGSGAAFLAHNLTDFTFFLVSGALPFWFGFGVLASLGRQASTDTGRAGRGGGISAAVRLSGILIVIVFVLSFAMAHVARQRVDHAVRLIGEAGIDSQAAAREVSPPPEAIELAIRAVSLKPYDDGMHVFLGNLYEGAAYEGGPEYVRLAEAEYKRAAELNPRSPYHYRDLGILCLKTGRKELAAEYFRKALSLHPTEPNLRKYLELSES